MLKLLTAKLKGGTRARLIRKYPEITNLLPKVSYRKPTKRFNTGRSRIRSMFSRYKSMSKLVDLSCVKCESAYKVEMHHVKPMKTVRKDSTWFESFHKRKQIPLCRRCHNVIHNN